MRNSIIMLLSLIVIVGIKYITTPLTNNTTGYIEVIYTENCNDTNTETDTNYAIKVQKKQNLSGGEIINSAEYTYILEDNKKYTINLTEGNGFYELSTYKHLTNNTYSYIETKVIEVDTDGKQEFIESTYYINYSDCGNDFNTLKNELKYKSNSNQEYIDNCISWVNKNITYDNEKAQLVKENKLSNYVTNIDEIIKTKKGICVDTATVLCGLLRSYGIPTKLIFGYKGNSWHAWNSVYLDNKDEWITVDTVGNLEDNYKVVYTY